MQRVLIDMVKPGMILAKTVTNEKGIALCAEGTELNANLIERLKKVDVKRVTLRGHPVDLGESEETKEQKLARLEERFAMLKGNTIMERLKQAIINAMLSQYEEEEAIEPNPVEEEQNNE